MSLPTDSAEEAENGTIQSFSAATAGKIAVNEIYTSLPGIGFEGIQAVFETSPQNSQPWLTPNTFQFGNTWNTFNNFNNNSGTK